MLFYKVSFAIVFSLIFLTGCYTTMKHPEIVDADNPQYDIPVYFTDDCNSCHQPGQFELPDQAKIKVQPKYISGNERWAYYYQNPWWTVPLFSGHPSTTSGGGGSSSGPLPTTSARTRYPGASGGSGSYAPSPTSIAGPSSGASVQGAGSSASTGGSNATVRSGTGDSGRKAVRGSGNSEPTRTTKRTKRK